MEYNVAESSVEVWNLLCYNILTSMNFYFKLGEIHLDKTLDRLTGLFRATMPNIEIGDVTRETSLDIDLGLDSLNTLLLGILIEDEFQVQFPTDYHPETVGDLCSFLEKAGAIE